LKWDGGFHFSILDFLVHTGAGDEVRTRDPQLGRLMLYQLSYARKKVQKSLGQVVFFIRTI
jgi:hypothetical protein